VINSAPGGALVDLSGGVTGIPTLAALDPQMGGAQASAVGFTIPSGTVTAVAAVSSRPADASARRATDAAMRGSSCASRDRDARGT
jgi:S1-C subfamily serine protease